MRVAVVGRRSLPQADRPFVRKLASYLVSRGHTIVSGGAEGTDTWAAEGAIRAGGEVEIYLPWPDFNAELHPAGAKLLPSEFSDDLVELARANHPVWWVLQPSSKRLMVRNANVASACDAMIAFPRYNEAIGPYGGTAHAMRCAEALGKKIYNLSLPEVRQRFVDKLKEAGIR